MIISLVLFLLFPFYFHFWYPISFTFTFQILFDLVLHLLFFLVFVLFHLLSFLSLFIPRNLLSQEFRVNINSFIIFSSWNIRKHVLIFLKLLFSKRACFKFYLTAVFMSLEHCIGCLFWSSLSLVALNLTRNEFLVIPETLWCLRWGVGVFSTFKESCIINL